MRQIGDDKAPREWSGLSGWRQRKTDGVVEFFSFIKTVFIKHLGLWGYNGEYDRTFDIVV